MLLSAQTRLLLFCTVFLTCASLSPMNAQEGASDPLPVLNFDAMVGAINRDHSNVSLYNPGDLFALFCKLTSAPYRVEFSRDNGVTAIMNALADSDESLCGDNAQPTIQAINNMLLASDKYPYRARLYIARRLLEVWS